MLTGENYMIVGPEQIIFLWILGHWIKVNYWVDCCNFSLTHRCTCSTVILLTNRHLSSVARDLYNSHFMIRGCQWVTKFFLLWYNIIRNDNCIWGAANFQIINTIAVTVNLIVITLYVIAILQSLRSLWWVVSIITC